jgi:hypothetical protein
MKNFYKLMRIAAIMAVIVAMSTVVLIGCDTSTNGVDAVTSASTPTNQYYDMTKDELLTAISQYQGVCTVSTVNAEGTSNIGVFVPGVVGTDHLTFGWAKNATKENFLRTKSAVMIYDVVNTAGAEKTDRHRGAKVVLVLEEDAAVIAELKETMKARLVASGRYTEEQAAALVEQQTFCKIKGVLPIG